MTQRLPSTVRTKMIALAAQGLSRMPADQMPPSLRPTANFAPARRAKLAGAQIAAAVETDDAFRAHLATQVRALVPRLIEGMEAGAPPDPGTLADSAAAAYIVRPTGWAEVIEAAQAAAENRQAGGGDLAGTVDRLSSQLDQARGQAKAVRERLRVQLDELKSDNATLRRTLGQTRLRLKEAEAAAAGSGDALDQLQREADVAGREADAEVRRLRGRIADLESESTSTRRAARGNKDAENTRLRLLLETIVEAASGLRRELALPPSDALPAETVASVEPAAAGHASGVGRAMLDDDPALLRQLLLLPRTHLVVDGYNVSKTAWATAPLDQQRSRLVGGVAALVAGKGIETTVVFDGAELDQPPMVTSPRAVRVRFSPPGTSADDLIRHLVEAEPAGRSIVVVSTDREVAESVTAMGARSVASLALVKAMGS